MSRALGPRNSTFVHGHSDARFIQHRLQLSLLRLGARSWRWHLVHSNSTTVLQNTLKPATNVRFRFEARWHRVAHAARASRSREAALRAALVTLRQRRVDLVVDRHVNLHA